MAELKNTIVNGILNVNGDLIASKIIKRGGLSTQVLMADGSVKTIGELITDTGATSIEVTGSGNAVTSASYNASTRKITLSKDTTFLTTADTIKIAANDILSFNAANELNTQYSIKTTVAVGNLASGTTVNCSVKELLDLVFGTPTKITSFTLTDGHGSFEKGTTKSLTKAVVKIQKGTANTLDKIEIRSGSASGTVLATLASVNDGNNTITIPTQTITADTTIYAVLTHDGSNTKSSSLKYTFYYCTYYGAVSAATSVDSITYTSLTKKNGNTGLKVTMSNQCAVLAIPGTSAKTIKDENNFDCTGNFSKTTKTIINSLGASATYTVFKLITPVSGTKTYTVS